MGIWNPEKKTFVLFACIIIIIIIHLHDQLLMNSVLLTLWVVVMMLLLNGLDAVSNSTTQRGCNNIIIVGQVISLPKCSDSNNNIDTNYSNIIIVHQSALNYVRLMLYCLST